MHGPASRPGLRAGSAEIRPPRPETLPFADVAAAKPRLLILNQYYWPGVEATAHLLSQLCEALADDFDVTVVTGRLLGHGELPAQEDRNGVRIIRVRSTAYERSELHRRAANYVSYLLESVRTALR